MQELEATKLRLDLPSHELPQHNQYLQPHRPVEAVQTSLTALPGLDWAQYSQQRSAPAWTGKASPLIRRFLTISTSDSRRCRCCAEQRYVRLWTTSSALSWALLHLQAILRRAFLA